MITTGESGTLSAHPIIKGRSRHKGLDEESMQCTWTVNISIDTDERLYQDIAVLYSYHRCVRKRVELQSNQHWS
jgi:hypothetical protein